MSKTFPYIYIRKKIRPAKEGVVPIQCKAIQYGLGCFTGIRGHWDKTRKNLYLFRLEDHYKRLKEGSKALGMKFDYTFSGFKKIIFDLIKKNRAKEDIYLRPTLYAASTKLTPRFDNPDDDLAIYMISLKDYFNTEKGLNTCVTSWVRIEHCMLPLKSKCTGGYVNSALAKTEAIKKGYDEAIFLDRDGNVCEASGANIIGIKDGVVWTPPQNANILNGITRQSLIKLFKNELKVKVREENFKRGKLYTFDELFFSGTAAKVAFIASVDKKKIGNGEMGPLTKKVKELFERASLCELPKYKNWCTLFRHPEI